MCGGVLSCVQFFCNPMDSSPLGLSVRGILQARISEWFAIAFSRRSSQPMFVVSPALAGGFFTTEPPLLDMSPTGRTVLTLHVPQTWHSTSISRHLDPYLAPLVVMTSDEKQSWEHGGGQGWLDLSPCGLRQ